MEYESFIFYRSFYDAIRPLPKDVQGEIYTAVMEYALYGSLPPALKPIANSVFTLVRPIIDANRNRRDNGKAGGRPPKNKINPTPVKPQVAVYALSFTEEVDQMKSDSIWNEPVCMQYRISPEELSSRLDTFVKHCECEFSDKPHSSINDARRHFLAWMRKAYPACKMKSEAIEIKPDYEYKGGFGGQDV